jgi:hypothetical protein
MPSSKNKLYKWARKVLPDVKDLFDKPFEVKRRRSKYAIYK